MVAYECWKYFSIESVYFLKLKFFESTNHVWYQDEQHDKEL